VDSRNLVSRRKRPLLRSFWDAGVEADPPFPSGVRWLEVKLPSPSVTITAAVDLRTR
jgi:hypothetical protein